MNRHRQCRLAALLVLALTVGCQPSKPPATSTAPAAKPPESQSPAAPAAETPSQSLAPAADTPSEPAASMPALTGAEAPSAPAAAAPAGAASGAELITVPVGLPPLPIPADNPVTAAKIELGKLLYFDTRLSKDGTISCATCHDPQMAWTEHEPTSTGINGQVGGRNSPTVINAAFAPAQFWDGRAASLEAQALGPMENPIEMGHQLPDVLAALNQVEGYRQRFQDVFGTEVTADGIAKAIATFERTVLSGNSPYDRYQAGDTNALTDEQKRGMEVFESAGCSTCHTPPLFSNYRYFNAGVDADKEKPDEGLKTVSNRDSDLGKFRVPPLRDVANTGPYFHDGSAQTLEQAVALMVAGGKDNPDLSPMMKTVRDAAVSEADQKSLVEFLKALSGEFPVVQPPTPLP